jgi:hypothetical protein
VVVVPKTWVNDRVFLEGIAPTAEMNEMAYILMIRQALDMSIPPGKFRVPKKFFSSPED